MHTLVAFSESLDPAGVMANLAGVPDQHVKVEGDGITVPEYDHLIGGHACLGALGAQALLISPSLRTLNPYQLRPISIAIDNRNWISSSLDPQIAIPLKFNEVLEAQENSNPAAAEQHTILAILAPGPIEPVKGIIFPVRAQITLALVAGRWTFSILDFIDELPVGDYNIVGMEAVIDTAVGIRIIPVGSAWRPGMPCPNDVDDPHAHIFRKGQFGVWAQFNTTQPPNIEVIGSAAVASTTYEIVLDVMPLQ